MALIPHTEQASPSGATHTNFQLADVNHDRETTPSPISILPPELLHVIFLHLVKRQDLFPLFEDHSRRSLRIIRVCHVCSAWREVALHHVDLWTNILIHGGISSPSLFDDIWKKPHDHPIRVHYFEGEWDGWDGTEKADPRFTHILQTAANRRIEKIAIDIPDLFLGIMPSDMFDNVVDLPSLNFRVRATWGPTDMFPRDLSRKNINLRRLQISGCQIPWIAPLLHSPHLTHLFLDSVPRFTEAHTVDFFKMLMTVSSQLISLHITNVLKSAISTEYLADRTHPLFLSPPIVLPNLRSMAMRSCMDQGVLHLLLSILRFPPPIALSEMALEGNSWKYGQRGFDRTIHNFQEPQDLFDVWMRAHGALGEVSPIIDPEQVHISRDGTLIKAWRKLSPSQESRLSPERGTLTEKPWITLRTPLAASFSATFPRVYREHMWSFSKLRVLSLEGDLPLLAWLELAALPALSVVQVATWFSGNFLDFLRGSPGHPAFLTLQIIVFRETVGSDLLLSWVDDLLDSLLAWSRSSEKVEGSTRMLEELRIPWHAGWQRPEDWKVQAGRFSTVAHRIS
ncbi:hypothetical protein DFP72DRAFT_946494, partial [Ephemerocybe angulata]